MAEQHKTGFQYVAETGQWPINVTAVSFLQPSTIFSNLKIAQYKP